MIAEPPVRPPAPPVDPDDDGCPNGRPDCPYTAEAHHDGGAAYGVVCPDEHEARTAYGDR